MKKDPNWTRKTFLEAASSLKIKPIQTYKWGYHKKMKENECQSEDKQAETKVIFCIYSFLNNFKV